MKILLFANTAWYLYNFRRSLAERLQAEGFDVLLASPPDPYGSKLEALGFRWIPIPMRRRSINPVRELVVLWWLHRMMRREGIELVHSFTIKCVIYGSIAARWARIKSRVGSAAGMGFVFTQQTIQARVLRLIARAMMHIALGGPRVRLIVQNADDYKFFVDTGLMPEHALKLIPSSGVNAERFRPAEVNARLREIGGRDGFRVLLPARLLWDKGVAEFVDAARLLRAANLPIHFLLAGAPDEGNPTAVPESKILEWQSEGLVEWLGHVDDMPELLRSVDAVALPSYREGLPKGLIEAAACALPLVTTDVPGCREVVTHEKDGLLIPVRDAHALARAIKRLYDDPKLAAQLGSNARKSCLARYDERRVIADTLAVYDALCSPKVHETAV